MLRTSLSRARLQRPVGHVGTVAELVGMDLSYHLEADFLDLRRPQLGISILY